MSDRLYPGDDEIIVAIYDHFGISMFDAERWFKGIKADEIERLEVALRGLVDPAEDVACTFYIFSSSLTKRFETAIEIAKEALAALETTGRPVDPESDPDSAG